MFVEITVGLIGGHHGGLNTEVASGIRISNGQQSGWDGVKTTPQHGKNMMGTRGGVAVLSLRAFGGDGLPHPIISGSRDFFLW